MKRAQSPADTTAMMRTTSLRRWVIGALLGAAAFATTACHVEQSADGQWWVCETAQTANGPVSGCQKIDLPTIK